MALNQHKDIKAITEQVTSHAEVPHGHVIGDATFWVAMATLLFVVLLVWKKIPSMISKALDDRSNAIKDQLDNARHLREEASALLAKYQRDQHEAEKNAQEMIAHAEAEAKLLADEAKADMAVMIERRTKIAAEKIKQAEANAIKEIRAITVEVASATARDLIASNLKKADRDALIKESIDTLDKRFH
jgi:F-type H+-transporting ATPase subunit b